MAPIGSFANGCTHENFKSPASMKVERLFCRVESSMFVIAANFHEKKFKKKHELIFPQFHIKLFSIGEVGLGFLPNAKKVFLETNFP